jgi:hypothetical protein
MEVPKFVVHLSNKTNNINVRMSPSVLGPMCCSIIVRVIVVEMTQKNMEDKVFPFRKRHISQCRPVCKIVVGVTGAGFQKVLVRRQKNI